jgi:GMP synthase-like glutamine amidotransferase
LNPSRTAVVLQHADFEGPARIAELLAAAGYAIRILRLHRGDPVPPAVDRESPLIVMGGSMGVGDIGRADFPFLSDEIRLLRQRIEDDAPVLGICLGAQLLAHAAGAPVYPMTRHGASVLEVGWAPVRLHREVNDDSLDRLPREVPFLHWHGDMFELPPGATRLASSAACPNQAFRLKRRLFGLQFHCEVTRDHVESFLREDADFVVRARGPAGAAAIREETATCLEASRTAGDTLLRNILRPMTRRP